MTAIAASRAEATHFRRFALDRRAQDLAVTDWIERGDAGAGAPRLPPASNGRRRHWRAISAQLRWRAARPPSNCRRNCHGPFIAARSNRRSAGFRPRSVRKYRPLSSIGSGDMSCRGTPRNQARERRRRSAARRCQIARRESQQPEPGADRGPESPGAVRPPGLARGDHARQERLPGQRDLPEACAAFTRGRETIEDIDIHPLSAADRCPGQGRLRAGVPLVLPDDRAARASRSRFRAAASTCCMSAIRRRPIGPWPGSGAPSASASSSTTTTSRRKCSR